MSMKTSILKLIILGFVLFVACSKQDTLTPAVDDQKLEQLGKEIQEFAKNKACSGGDNCRSMAMGAKICGGPTSYIIYSLSTTDEKKLIEMVNEFTALQKQINFKNPNQVGTCDFIVAPKIDCRNGVCTSK